MTVKFNLHSKKKELTLIYLIFRYGQAKPIQYSTGEKINPKFWDDSKERAKRNWPGYKLLNMLLDKLEEEAKVYYRSCQLQEVEFTKEGFRDKLNEIRQKKEAQEDDRSFLTYFQSFIEDRSVKLSDGRKKHYQTTINHIKALAPKIDWEGINDSFFYRFLEHLYAVPMQTNTARQYIKVLKKVMKEGKREGYHNNDSFLYFTVPEKPVDKTYFTLDELNYLYHMQLEGYREKTRDLALVYAFTGVRFQDLWKIGPDSIENKRGKQYIKIKTKKSQMTTEAVIPLHPIVEAILNKYNGVLPKISNQKFNDYIKVVAKDAGFTEPFKMVKNISGKPTEVTQPKYECISTHTFRRTFITLAHEDGIPYKVIMDIVGIKKVETIMKYIVSPKEKSAEIVANSSLFKAPILRKVQ